MEKLNKKLFQFDPHLVELKDYRFIQKGNKNPPRKLTDSSPRLKYESWKGELKSIMHWGQRKLFMSELEFLTNYVSKLHKKKGNTVLYIGAAPGIHIPYLSSLFPELNWILYDPNKFAFKPTDKIKIYNQFFTEVDINKYKSIPLLFISDIRGGNIGSLSEDKQNEVILDNMRLQSFIYDKLNPVGGLLKFRLPWNDMKTKYLDGELYFQVWQGNRSTEGRLVPKKIQKYKIYDNRKYEEQMYYHNIITRRKYYKHNYGCLCHCYDCYIESQIIEKYLKKVRKISPNNICIITETLTKILTKKDISFLNYSRNYVTEYNEKLFKIASNNT